MAQNKRSLARIINIVKILHERRYDAVVVQAKVSKCKTASVETKMHATQVLIIFALASFFLMTLSAADETTTQAPNKPSGLGPFVTGLVENLTKIVVDLLKNLLGG
ncbi:hypothetical protein AVEN_222057-1 [Araneus ventricosus]|uniref:Uncharacterized protein n=1 Tax=Araneus ventricosus TaxID=182803 RepID=A0A4Y2N5Q1_ARAVE|nr:hypothetical protein AVEN_222057-1 [Araneus ventricosus]